MQQAKCFTVKGKCKDEAFSTFGRFGFKLISINRPVDYNEEQEMRKAITWYENNELS